MRGSKIRQLALGASERESLWPAGLASLFKAAADVPWVALTTIMTVIGTALLMAYLKLVGYVGADANALLGLAVAAALAAAAFLLAIGVCLVFPALVARELMYGDPAGLPRMTLASRQLVAIQLIFVGVLLGVGGVRDAVACAAWPNWVEWTGLAIAAPSIAICGHWIFKAEERKFLPRLIAMVFACVASGMPLLILLGIAELFDNALVGSTAIILSIWIVLIFLNTFLVKVASGQAVAVLALMIACVALVVVPVAIGRIDFIPVKVAALIGIRSERPLELLVTKQACDLAQAAARAAALPEIPCRTEITALPARMLVAVGSRWLVELHTAGGGSVSVTLPADQLQIRWIADVGSVAGKGSKCAARQQR